MNMQDLFSSTFGFPASRTVTRPDLNRATELTPEVEAAIDDQFQYRAASPEQIAAMGRVRDVLALAVKQLIRDVPPGPDRSTAIRKIREARMDANSAITHGAKD